ncbi:fasciclin domain-containing protein [Chitinophaga pendula]|uniref:fasciclin domain-containing protein n=1 Tax=Chitinophaga TaxID=79328 RepID=UPI000BAF4214|nr:MULTISPECIES: fasciclin domain-containing protein [Chitinophaga]ASZ12146.1 hypothetical protein CK934_14850 [Chitinophaga sp. MD30]UCJ04814.1 fasciclin domain-containing protein [Chitinophaga pendula]
MKKIIYISMLLLWLSACIKKDAPSPAAQKEARSISILLGNNYAFSLFRNAIKKAGLDSLTTGETPYTWLIPDNSAFERAGISSDSLERMPAATLKNWVLYHILRGKIKGIDIPQTLVFRMNTLEGRAVYTSTPLPGQAIYNVEPGKVYLHINGVNVDKPDLPAGNGHMHVLNKPLSLPKPTVKDIIMTRPEYSQFTAALKKFGLLDQLAGPGPVTILALSNTQMNAFGFDEAAMEHIGPETHQRFLFSCYILKDSMFFLSDIQDAYPGKDGTFFPGVIVQEDVLFFLDGGGLMVRHKRFQEGYPYDLQYGNGYAQLFTGVSDLLALNGVVHRIDRPMVVPEKALIR